MVTCQYCGTENNQPDAAYCTSCGSSLRQSQGSSSLTQSPSAPSTSTPPVAPSGWNYGRTGSGYELSDRYERAFKSVEQMANAVIVLAVIALVLVLY